MVEDALLWIPNIPELHAPLKFLKEVSMPTKWPLARPCLLRQVQELRPFPALEPRPIWFIWWDMCRKGTHLGCINSTNSCIEVEVEAGCKHSRSRHKQCVRPDVAESARATEMGVHMQKVATECVPGTMLSFWKERDCIIGYTLLGKYL